MSTCKRPTSRIIIQQASQRIHTMSPENSTHADRPMLPKFDQMTASTQAVQGQGMRAILEAPSIGLVTYLLGWSIGLGEDFGSGVIVTTGLISAARFVDSGFSKTENIISIAILGLFAQLVCYHFELGLIIRTSNALSTCCSVYVAMGNNSPSVEEPEEGLHDIDNKHPNEQTAMTSKSR